MFLENTSNMLENLTNSRDCKLFLGDIKINIKDDDEISIKYLTTMHEFGFISTINNYSRVKTKSRLLGSYICENIQDLELLLSIRIQTDAMDHFTTTLQTMYENKYYNHNNAKKIYINSKINSNVKEPKIYITNGLIKSMMYTRHDVSATIQVG